MEKQDSTLTGEKHRLTGCHVENLIMDSRSAWRFLDFLKDFLMHHRNYTPFQKIVFVSCVVGVLILILHNLWSLGLALSYGLSMYASVKVSAYISTRRGLFPSHIILIWIEKLDTIYRPFISSVFVQENYLDPQVTDKSDKNENSTNVSEIAEQMTHHEQQEKVDRSIQDLRENKNEVPVQYFNDQTREIQGTSDNEEGEEDLVLDLQPTNRIIDTNNLIVCSKDVYTELTHLVKLVKRDFIESWYCLFSTDESGLAAAEEVLYYAFDNLQTRVSKTQFLNLIKCVIIMYRNHVRLLKQSKLMYRAMRRRKSSLKPSKSETGLQTKMAFSSVEECYATKIELHPATKSSECEKMYLKAITEFLLMHILPEDITSTKTVTCALKEILMHKVLQSVISLLSETTFLHECIVRLTSDEKPGECVEGSPVIIITGTETPDEQIQSILVKKDLGSGTVAKTEAEKSAALIPTGSQEKNQQELPAVVEAAAAVNEIKTSTSSLTNIMNSDIGKDTTSTSRIGSAKSSEPMLVRWKEDTVVYPVSKGICNECNRLSSKDKDKISPRPHTCALRNSPSFFDDEPLSKCSASSSYEETPVFTLQDEDDEAFSDQSNIPYVSNHSAKMRNSSSNHKLDPVAELLPGCSEVKALEDKTVEEFGKPVSSSIFPFNFPNPFNLSRPSFLDRKRSSTSLTSECGETVEEATLDIPGASPAGEVNSEKPSPTTPLDGPSPDQISLFQDIRIVETEIAKEPGRDANYTLYNIEYEGLYPSEDSNQLVMKTGIVKRRYSEFLNLQSRVEDNAAYKRSLKDVKRPKTIMPALPFGNMGKEAIENRKSLLEQFLKDMIKKKDLCNGEEMKQFLGYSGDGHLAFVRKLPENTGQGINKRLAKTMSGVFDKFIEGIQEIPSLPQQLPRLLSDLREREGSRQPLVDTDQLHINYLCGDSDAEENQFESVLDKFLADGNVTLGTSVLGWQGQTSNQQSVSSHSRLESGTNTCTSLKHSPTPPTTHRLKSEASPTTSHVPGTIHIAASGPHPLLSSSSEMSIIDGEGHLSETVLDIVSELLQGQDNWLCRETVMHTTRFMFGAGLHRILKMKLESFLTPDMCSFYLHTLHTIFWPNDILSIESRPKLNDHERDVRKKQAARCLREFLPGLLRPLLGEDDFNVLVDEAMASIEYEKLNRHFWYTVLDVILEQLFPEITSPDLQRKLSECVDFH